MSAVMQIEKETLEWVLCINSKALRMFAPATDNSREK